MRYIYVPQLLRNYPQITWSHAVTLYLYLRREQASAVTMLPQEEIEFGIKGEHKSDGETKNAMNHFDGLPDEVLIFIISKIDDLKSVCRCTAVSKRFASHTCHAKSVTVRLPGIDKKSLWEDSNPCRLFCWIGDNGEQETLELIDQQSIYLKLQFLNFLEKFTKLESVTLEVGCPRTPCTTPLLKWALKFLGSGPAASDAMVEGLVSLLPTSILKDSDEDDEKDEGQHTHVDVFGQHTHVDVFDFLRSRGGENALLFPLMCCCEWLLVVKMLIIRIHSIRRVTCMDAEKHGGFKLGDEQLAEWRRRLAIDPGYINTKPRTVSIGWVPDLRLPKSGIRLKGVFCVFVDFEDGVYLFDEEPGFVEELNFNFNPNEAGLNYYEVEVEDEDEENPFAPDPNFFKTLEYDDGEEKVMSEAVNEIVDKHWNMVKWSYILP